MADDTFEFSNSGIFSQNLTQRQQVLVKAMYFNKDQFTIKGGFRRQSLAIHLVWCWTWMKKRDLRESFELKQNVDDMINDLLVSIIFCIYVQIKILRFKMQSVEAVLSPLCRKWFLQS